MGFPQSSREARKKHLSSAALFRVTGLRWVAVKVPAFAVLAISLLPVCEAWASPKIGDKIPEVRLPSIHGTDTLDLKDLRGSVVLLDFWASWCLPCKKLMPKLTEISARHPNLKLVTLSVDEDPRKARKFLLNLAPGLVGLHDAQKKAADGFGLEGMPASFLIDHQGNLRFRHDGYTERDLGLIERQIAVLEKERVNEK
jgi:thiol-disulfide isomerase/thioredoxin